MKVLFLDIDGVLNSAIPPADPDMVAQTNRITDSTGAKIVIHSSWRYAYDLEALRKFFKEWGVTGEVIDTAPTPEGYTLRFSGEIKVGDEAYAEFVKDMPTDDERAAAVQHWLNDHPEVKDFVIFDDCDALGHFMGTKRFIRTRMSTGITPELADRAIRVLKRVTWAPLPGDERPSGPSSRRKRPRS